jgi:stage III sporulation protein AA
MEEPILSFMPQRIKQALVRIAPVCKDRLEEIRIRIGRPIELIIDNKSYFLTSTGEITFDLGRGLIADIEDGQKIMNLISRHSIYAIEEELRRGYITVRGGHRIGITGRTVVEGGKIKLLKDIKSFNVRIARQMIGIANPILPMLMEDHQFLSTLIISPPRCGKTTLVRDLVRLLSYGSKESQLLGQKVGVVDERSEIASCMEGIPQNDLGPRVDVLDACPKAEGMMLLIRSMSPEVVVTDEIGSEEDTNAILEALHAGVKLLTTAHGSSLANIQGRPSLQPIFEQHVFDRYLILSKRNGAGTIEAILDRQHRHLKGWVGGGIRSCLS